MTEHLGQTEAALTCPLCAKEFKALSAFYRHLKTAHQAGQGQRTKFNNRKVELDGFIFDSQREAQRYQELLLLQRAGEIEGLSVHTSWPLAVNGIRIGVYESDFDYRETIGPKRTVEDAKSEPTKTRLYCWKKKHMKAQYGIEIREV